jgi:hypothetical protein
VSKTTAAIAAANASAMTILRVTAIRGRSNPDGARILVDPPIANQHDTCQKSALSTNSLFIDADYRICAVDLSADVSDRSSLAHEVSDRVRLSGTRSEKGQ